MKKDLFKKFESDKISNLHFCVGGERSGTTCDPETHNGCGVDSQNVEKTPVAGQPEGYTQFDYSDWQLECGLADPGQGGGSGTGTLPPALPSLP